MARFKFVRIVQMIIVWVHLKSGAQKKILRAVAKVAKETV